MEDIELIRDADNRRIFHLGSIGSLRLNGWLMRSATAQVGLDALAFRRTGWSSAALEATDDLGRTVGTFRPNRLRRGGELAWLETEYSLRPATPMREQYLLVAADRELASIQATGWWGWGARRPLRMLLMADGVDPGLLLFSAFVVRTLADKASSDASGTSVVASTGAYVG